MINPNLLLGNEGPGQISNLSLGNDIISHFLILFHFSILKYEKQVHNTHFLHFYFPNKQSVNGIMFLV